MSWQADTHMLFWGCEYNMMHCSYIIIDLLIAQLMGSIFFLHRISDYMDLTPVDIVGKRCYHFIHAEDVEGIRHSHLDCKYFKACQNELALQLLLNYSLHIVHFFVGVVLL